jgi:hypothetical protein
MNVAARRSIGCLVGKVGDGRLRIHVFDKQILIFLNFPP